MRDRTLLSPLNISPVTPPCPRSHHARAWQAKQGALRGMREFPCRPALAGPLGVANLVDSKVEVVPRAIALHGQEVTYLEAGAHCGKETPRSAQPWYPGQSQRQLTTAGHQ
jgi:hypothetical protein